ncbi:MAG: porphobilinogen synthase, partial [Peptostreptococcus sp.]|nr:porphobilinogen synthase [Peptostreptococcus sp.]
MKRPRRLRVSGIMRDLVRETRLDMKTLVYPLFIV